MLSEQIGFGFFFKGSFENTGPGRANAMRISQSAFARVSGGVLINRQQGRNSVALAVNPAQQMARALGSNHHDVDILRRLDGFEMDTEPVRDA